MAQPGETIAAKLLASLWKREDAAILRSQPNVRSMMFRGRNSGRSNSLGELG